MRFTLFLALLLSTTFFIGCREDNPFGTVPVEGVVTLDGAAIPLVSVTLIPREGAHSAGGQTDANGKFTVATGGYSGAKPGTYDVTFSKIEIPGGDLSMEEHTAKYGGRQPEPVYLVPKKYESPKTSGIEPITVDSNKKNSFTFELTTK